MQHELNHTVQALLSARGLDEVPRETLSALVREHPYSALLHLLYSKKLQQLQDTRYAESVARTALYFSNPHWLHHLLRPRTSRDAVQEMEQAFAEHAQETPVEPEPEFAAPVVDAEFHTGTTEAAIDTDLDQAPEAPPVEETPQPSGAHSPAAWQEPVVRALETIPEVPGFGLPSPETAETEQAANVSEPAPEMLVETSIPAKGTLAPDDSVSVSETPLETSIPAEGPVAPDDSVSVSEMPVETSIPAKGPVAPVDSGLLPLEPYYTIDYFASQGIQLSEDEKQDPLGRKLKKFTEWLKTMKKIHPDKSGPVAGDSQSEETIREGAEHSNDRAEVVTEAMAEVYAKQGQPDKALEIYRKLSLLDPSRSATFAAKIAELNNPDR
jgi:hypothetical protein